MKITGSNMESQKTTFCTMAEEPLAKGTKTSIKFAIAGLIGLFIIGAIALAAVLIGGKIANDSFQQSFVFRTKSGEISQETITVTGKEEEIGLPDGTRVVYDFDKGIMIMKIAEDGEHICYVTTFDRSKLRLPSKEDLVTMDQYNLNATTEIDYYVDKSVAVNPAMLSQRSRDICTGSNMYWMSTSTKEDTSGRQKRGCQRVCGAYCTCCPRDCGIRCSIRCSW